jgi:hypothetical protein
MTMMMAEASLSHFKAEDLNDYRRKCQAYLAEKEALHSSIEKSPNAVWGQGASPGEVGNEK